MEALRPGPDPGALAARVAAAVPAEAQSVAVVDTPGGVLAAELAHPGRVVHVLGPASPEGIGGDVPGEVDALVYGDSLSRLLEPSLVLAAHRRLLRRDGTVVVAVPNLQHHSVVRQLLRGVFPYGAHPLLDPAYVRLYTAAGAIQLLLDAGYLPDAVDRLEDDDDVDHLDKVGASMFEQLGVGAKDAERDLRTSWIVLRAAPLPDVGSPDDTPVTFVACVNDEDQLAANLARSPCFAPGSTHELLTFRHCANAAEGLNAGIAQAAHDLVVLVHQDVYVPAGWPARLRHQWAVASAAGGDIAVAGVFGVRSRDRPFDAIGRVVHRDRLLSHHELPADVDGLDELLMVVPRATRLRVDPALGWHLYGTDLALQAATAGERVVVLDAPCHHNSLTGRVPVLYRSSERALARKWPAMLPIHTNLSSIDTWLLDAEDAADSAHEVALPEPGDDGTPATTELVARLRREQVALNVELEQARLQVASMRRSPFWRAREVYAAARQRLTHRR